MRYFRCFPLLTIAICVFSGSTRAAAQAAATATGFSLKDTGGDHLDILLDGKIVGRYVYAHDNSTPERRAATFKPYLHVFDAEGQAPITKGPGGLFPHHHGIFIGWNKIKLAGSEKTFDRWHMSGGEIVHDKFIDQKADTNQATIAVQTHWDGPEKNKPAIAEERIMTFQRGPAPFRVTIDFTSKLTAILGDLELNGDPEHSGIHYRPANELSKEKTVYTYPKEKAAPHKDTDYPWVGMSYVLNGKQYSIVEMSHPEDPKGTRWSAYRDYGRFGAFPVANIKKDESLTVKYRFLVADGEMPSVAAIEKSYDGFAGTATPVPATTVLPAEASKPAAPKAPKPAATPTPTPAPEK